jgi:hypothetical protein
MASRKKNNTSLEQKIDALTTIVEKGFSAVAGDIADVRRELKGDIAAVHEQVNSIETQLRETRIEIRLADLEEKVFGKTRR